MTSDPTPMPAPTIHTRLAQALPLAKAVDSQQVSRLLAMLPAVFQEDRVSGGPNFLGRFLLGFEHLLLGPPTTELLQGSDSPGSHAEGVGQGLEQTIASLHRFFEPGYGLAEGERAPPEFLPWLASWVALTLREDWPKENQRAMIAQAVSLYRLRGTKRGVEEFLKLHTNPGVTIEEYHNAFQIGVHSTIGKDTLLKGGLPFFFRVTVYLPMYNPAMLKNKREIALAIIELQKPAHTLFRLEMVTPTFQVGINSRVGVSTVLG